MVGVDDEGLPLPPWLQLSEAQAPAGSVHWRMGRGEEILGEVFEALAAVSAEARLAWLVRYRPLPDPWVLFAAELLALPSVDDDDIDAAVGRLASAGLIELD